MYPLMSIFDCSSFRIIKVVRIYILRMKNLSINAPQSAENIYIFEMLVSLFVIIQMQLMWKSLIFSNDERKKNVQ